MPFVPIVAVLDYEPIGKRAIIGSSVPVRAGHDITRQSEWGYLRERIALLIPKHGVYVSPL